MESLKIEPKEMPGPTTSALQEMGKFGNDPLAYFEHLAGEYGDYVRMKLLLGEGALLVDPQAIEEVLVRKKKHFIKGRSVRALGALLGKGLLVSEGDFWRRQRRLAQPAFHKDRIAQYAGRMVAFGGAMIDRWQPGQALDIHDEMVKVTLQIVADALFSANVAQHADTVGHSLETTLAHFQWWSRNAFIVPIWVPVGPNRKFRRAKADLDRIVNGLIAERMARPEGERGGDLLGMLLSARDEDGTAMSAQQVRDEVMTLMLAGHETTANTMTWTALLLSRNPDARRKLEDELQRVLGGRPPTLADLPNLPYNEMVIKESMRVYPPVWVLGYEAAEDTLIGPYTIRKGTAVFMSQWINHHDARWFPEPQAFRPERWADPATKHLPTYAYFPFGGGERLCIGKSFALMEAQLLLGTVAQRYRLDVVPDQTIGLDPSVTLRPAHGLKVIPRAI
jgi:cytochrome P450